MMVTSCGLHSRYAGLIVTLQNTYNFSHTCTGFTVVYSTLNVQSITTGTTCMY